MSKASATFTPTHAREHIKDSADCLQNSIETLKRVIRRFPMATTEFPQILSEIERLRDQIREKAVEFELKVEMKNSDVLSSRKVPESCRPSA